MLMKKWAFGFATFFCLQTAIADNGYSLWLRYEKLTASQHIDSYKYATDFISLFDQSSTTDCIKSELLRGLKGYLGVSPVFKNGTIPDHGLVLARFSQPEIKGWVEGHDVSAAGEEGFVIKQVKQGSRKLLLIAAKTDIGLLYGSFHLLRLIGTLQPIENIHLVSAPKVKFRMLNHWDNLNRTVERGYAGSSIWDWHTLPDYINPRYIDYARSNASIGINGTVLTNVNANATFLSAPYIEKVKALADAFRPYGIRVYLTARFSAPIEIGNLKTADPLDPAVQQWWTAKAAEIYKTIPDFGGFLVKANSEGQPGPQNYGRNHADGANMLAAAVKPFGGIIIWRAFVYSSEAPDDRFKQPYSEFVLLDGKFADNVILQVKNGPIDFQPREPFHPLFGALPKTSTGLEVQLTQEYLGFSTHLAYLSPLFSEVLNTDTYRPQQGSTVASIVDGTAYNYHNTLMAGVANIGSDVNWCGHPFAQANWYALGMLAWNHTLSDETIASEWIQQTFTHDVSGVKTLLDMMMKSRENIVNYMTPLGLHHIMGYGHHYGPAPWFNKASREDWNCTYFHRADSVGIGFDRTASGSNALAQYAGHWQQQFGYISTTPDKWLLWFHHVPWNYRLKDGNTFWQSLCLHYQQGVDGVRKMQQQWNSQEKNIDAERFRQVKMLLAIQQKEAVWWRDACLSYFQTFSKMPLPSTVEKPAHTLDYYKQLQFPFAPGTGH